LSLVDSDGFMATGLVCSRNRRSRAFQRLHDYGLYTWIPAFAGMTRLSPIAATLRVLLLDSCVS
jgi:hypothetical protein